MENEILEKLVTDITIGRRITVSSTTFTTPTTAGGTDMDCKIIEVRNYTGVDILVNPNNSEPLTVQDGKERCFMVKKLSDIQIARATGSGNITIELGIEK